jgi:hypothetical protein
MAVNDKTLMAAILASTSDDPDPETRVDPTDLPLVQSFVDVMGNPWSQGELVPKMGAETQPPFRNFALFRTDDDVTVYAVPTTDRYPADAFRRFTLHRMSPSVLVERMTEDVFKREVADELDALEEAQFDLGDPEKPETPAQAVADAVGITAPVEARP